MQVSLERLKPRRGLKIDLVWLSSFTIVFLVFLYHAEVKGDTLWTVMVGEQIVRGQNFLTDSWSWTSLGNPTYHHSWLWSLTTYLLYKVGGGTFVLNYLLHTFLMVLPFLLARPSEKWREDLGLKPNMLSRAHIFILPLLPFVFFLGEVRVQAVSVALFTLMLWLILRERFVWLPLLLLLWANVHAGFLVGPILAGAFGIVTGLVYLRTRQREDLRRFVRLFTATLIGTLLTLLNPLGFDLWLYIFDAFTMDKAPLLEYRPVWETYTPLILFLGILAANLIVVSIGWGQRKDWRLLGLAFSTLAFTALSASVMRFLPFALVLTVFFSTVVLMGVKSSKWNRSLRVDLIPAMTVWLIFTSGAATFLIQDEIKDEEVKTLTPALGRALASCESGATYNDYFSGAYLLFYDEGRKVFQDNRWDPYGPEVRKYSNLTDENWEDFQEDWPVECIFAATENITSQTAWDNCWQVLYSDEMWSLFRRPRLTLDL